MTRRPSWRDIAPKAIILLGAVWALWLTASLPAVGA